MKLTGHIIEASDVGDEISVTLQGQNEGAANWRPMSRMTLRLPATDAVKRTYHLGRKINIEIKPA